MDCFVCSKKKKDYEVWTNKIIISATYDSEFQNNEIISKMSEKSIICHNCLKSIEIKVDKKKNV